MQLLISHDDVAYIEITNFNEDTTDRFTAAARQAVKAKVRGIILDVRGNPGGFLHTAVDIASRFLPKETVIVSEQGKSNDELSYFSRGFSLKNIYYYIW